MHAELQAAVAAGAQHFQIDERAFWIMPSGLPEMVDIIKARVQNIDARIGLHLCFGDFRGRPPISHRSYAAFAPYFRERNADILQLEFAFAVEKLKALVKAAEIVRQELAA